MSGEEQLNRQSKTCDRGAFPNAELNFVDSFSRILAAKSSRVDAAWVELHEGEILFWKALLHR